MQLRAMRIRKGKQQKELAKAIGTDEPMMSKFENYKCLPIPPMMTALCRELGCEVEDIYEPHEVYLAEYRSGGRMGVGNPTADDDATPKKLVYDELAKRAAYIEYSIDPTTFIITLELKNFEGKVLDSKSVDLPLETMIIGAWYDEGTVYLKVKGEEEPLAVDISDLISGLVNETTFNEQVARMDRRIDLTNQDVSSIRNEIDIAGVYGFGAFYAQEAEGARNFIGGGSIDRALKKRPTGLQRGL